MQSRALQNGKNGQRIHKAGGGGCGQNDQIKNAENCAREIAVGE